MKIRLTRTIALAAALSAAAFFGFTLLPRAVAQGTPEVKRTVLMRHDTPQAGYETLLIGVEIPVGGREGRHTHPGLAMIHVLEGTLSLDYEGKPTTDYKAGESFVVETNKIHEGINKGSQPIKAIGTFIVPKGAALTTQVK